MVHGEVEVRVAFDVGHLPAVDLVHLFEAFAAQFVHQLSSFSGSLCGTPRLRASNSRASRAIGSSTESESPSARAKLKSFSPSARVCWKGLYRKWSDARSFASLRYMIAPGPPFRP